MKFGVSLYSYSGDLHAQKMTVRECIEHAASIECEGVELIGEQHLPDWPNTSIEQLRELKKYIHSFGMEVTNLSTYLSNLIRTDRQQTTKELIETAKNHIAIANVLGAKICRPTCSANKETFIEILRACIPVLEENNVIWGIEVHSPYPPEYFTDVVTTVNSPNVKLIPDFSLWETQGLPGEFSSKDVSAMYELLPHICYVHGKAHCFNEEGEEPFTPYKELLTVLKENNYQGYVIAEYEGWMVQYTDSKIVAKTHVDLIKKYGK